MICLHKRKNYIIGRGYLPRVSDVKETTNIGASSPSLNEYPLDRWSQTCGNHSPYSLFCFLSPNRTIWSLLVPNPREITLILWMFLTLLIHTFFGTRNIANHTQLPGGNNNTAPTTLTFNSVWINACLTLCLLLQFHLPEIFIIWIMLTHAIVMHMKLLICSLFVSLIHISGSSFPFLIRLLEISADIIKIR